MQISGSVALSVSSWEGAQRASEIADDPADDLSARIRQESLPWLHAPRNLQQLPAHQKQGLNAQHWTSYIQLWKSCVVTISSMQRLSS